MAAWLLGHLETLNLGSIYLATKEPGNLTTRNLDILPTWSIGSGQYVKKKNSLNLTPKNHATFLHYQFSYVAGWFIVN